MSDSTQPIPISKHRLSEARRLGVTPRSPELTAGVMLLTAAWVGHACLPQLGFELRELVAGGFQGASSLQSPVSVELSPACVRVFQEVLRVWGACWAAALLTDLAQVGFVWSPVTLLPHEERISPAAGLARIVSWHAFERSSLLSIKLFGGVFAVAVVGEFALRSALSASESSTHLARGVTWTSILLACAGTLCLLFGILDAWLRQTRWRQALEQTEDERRRGE